MRFQRKHAAGHTSSSTTLRRRPGMVEVLKYTAQILKYGTCLAGAYLIYDVAYRFHSSYSRSKESIQDRSHRIASSSLEVKEASIEKFSELKTKGYELREKAAGRSFQMKVRGLNKIAELKAKGYDFRGRTAGKLDTGNLSLKQKEGLSAQLGLEDVSGHMEKNTSWRIEASNFPKEWPTLPKEKKRANKPRKKRAQVIPPPYVKILRCTEPYTGEVPVMRIVCYFPYVTPAQLYLYFTDIPLRRRWDKNYSDFRLVCSNQELVSQALVGIEQGRNYLPLVSHHDPVDDSDVETPHAFHVEEDGIEAVSFVPRKREWLLHTVASPFLNKFGVMPRTFLYERFVSSVTKGSIVEQQTAAGGPGNPMALTGTPSDSGAISIVYRSLCPKSVKKPFLPDLLSRSVGQDGDASAKCRSEKIAEVLDKNYDPKSQDLVFVHSQELLFVPTTDAVDAADKVGSLQFSPGLYHTAARKMQSSPKQHDKPSIATLGDEEIETGTIMVYTSANDIKLPKHMPLFVQRHVAKFFSVQAYGFLHSTIMEDFKALVD